MNTERIAVGGPRPLSASNPSDTSTRRPETMGTDLQDVHQSIAASGLSCPPVSARATTRNHDAWSDVEAGWVRAIRAEGTMLWDGFLTAYMARNGSRYREHALMKLALSIERLPDDLRLRALRLIVQTDAGAGANAVNAVWDAIGIDAFPPSCRDDVQALLDEYGIGSSRVSGAVGGFDGHFNADRYVASPFPKFGRRNDFVAATGQPHASLSMQLTGSAHVDLRLQDAG